MLDCMAARHCEMTIDGFVACGAYLGALRKYKFGVGFDNLAGSILREVGGLCLEWMTKLFIFNGHLMVEGLDSRSLSFRVCGLWFHIMVAVASCTQQICRA